ncbi:unnamed protein product [Staurois parvus]|uniref:Uncharacterized protein n=1 Tax=Staurois parvus TaxID=386267 RepID=A0ABN9CLL9_9NEOB|nr:unnamed protein product [Staurois parvus]
MIPYCPGDPMSCQSAPGPNTEPWGTPLTTRPQSMRAP